MIAAIALLGAGAGACERTAPHATPSEHASMPTVAEIIERRAPELMQQPGVVGVAEGRTSRDAPCIRILIVKRTPELEAKLPKTLDGYPVEIEETGVIRPLDGH